MPISTRRLFSFDCYCVFLFLVLTLIFSSLASQAAESPSSSRSHTASSTAATYSSSTEHTHTANIKRALSLIRPRFTCAPRVSSLIPSNICKFRSVMSTAATASSATAAATTSTPSKNTNIEITPRLSKDRGVANIGWLYSYHTFSFSSYYDPNFHNFHALRVINEDRVAPSEGFGKHPHREFEIFSYVVKGALRHQDSLGNLESLGRGYVQFTSAGTGLSHSEYNDSDKEYVHFIQMWVKPSKSGLKPAYATKHWSDAEKTNQLRLILSEGGQDGSIHINQDCKIYASILTPGSTVEYELQPGRELYLHLIQDTTDMTHELNRTGLTVDSLKGPVSFKGGDGAFIKQAGSLPGVQKLRITGAGVEGANAEFILFDMKKE